MAFKISAAIKLHTKTLRDDASGISLRVLDGNVSEAEVEQHAAARAVGVYVFALRKQGSSAAQPWYIGKTEQSALGREALTKDKLKKYATALAEPGTPLLYFLTPGSAVDAHRIDELETFLIWLARQKNPSLINKRKVHLSPQSLKVHLTRLVIAGLLNSSAGNPGLAASDFRSMIGWKKTMHVEGGF